MEQTVVAITEKGQTHRFNPRALRFDDEASAARARYFVPLSRHLLKEYAAANDVTNTNESV